jgi:hypothetical protein
MLTLLLENINEKTTLDGKPDLCFQFAHSLDTSVNDATGFADALFLQPKAQGYQRPTTDLRYYGDGSPGRIHHSILA